MNANQIEFRSSAIEPTKCVSEAWTTISSNYWLLFGVSMVGAILMFASGAIPVLGIVLGPLVSGPMLAGVYSVFLAQADGEKKDFGAMFDGFKKFGATVIVSFILAIPGILLQIYQLSEMIAQLSVLFGGGSIEDLANQPPFPPVLIGLYIFLLVFSLTVGLLLFFSYWLIMDHGLGAGEAIKLSSKAALENFGGLLLLVILEGLLMIAGALACLIGIFFMAPVVFLATAFAYRQVFPRKEALTKDLNPPSPDQYQFGQAT